MRTGNKHLCLTEEELASDGLEKLLFRQMKPIRGIEESQSVPLGVERHPGEAIPSKLCKSGTSWKANIFATGRAFSSTAKSLSVAFVFFAAHLIFAFLTPG